MDLKKLHKQKIIDDIFMSFNKSWSILIHDPISAGIIDPLFKKSDLLDYNITAIYSIADTRAAWDLPAIYFVNCTKEIAKTINQEFKDKKYPAILVFSLCEPIGLDPLIKCKVVELDIKIFEERIFRCKEENLSSLANILNAKFVISFIDCTKSLAEKINEQCTRDTPGEKEIVSLLILDRTIDLYTPLIFFLSFKSILCEIGTVDTTDSYFKEIRHLYLGDVGEHLQYTVKKLAENLKKLGSDKVDVAVLDSLVLEAPKNIETKKNVEKYFEYLQKCISQYETIKDMIMAQQKLVTGEDEVGNKCPITLDAFLSIIVSPGIPVEDRTGFLFLLKANGIVFTESEKTLLASKGFSKEDLDMKIVRRNQIIRHKPVKPIHSNNRYIPILLDVVVSFATKKKVFQTLNVVDTKANSLRRSTMISSEKPPRRIIAVYVKNGLSIEETMIAYKLTESLGIEFVFGSEKILTRKKFVEEYRKNQSLHETAFIDK